MKKLERILSVLLQTMVGTLVGFLLSTISIETWKRAEFQNGFLSFIFWMAPIILGVLLAGYSNKQAQFKILPAVIAALILLPGSLLFSLLYVCYVFSDCL